MLNNLDPYDNGTPKYQNATDIYDALETLLQTEEMGILADMFADVSWDNQDYIYTEKGSRLKNQFDRLSDYGDKMWILDLAVYQIDKKDAYDFVYPALNNPDLARRLGFKKLFVDCALVGDILHRYNKVIKAFEYELQESSSLRYDDVVKAFGKAMSENGAPPSYNPYPHFNSFCYHLGEKICSLKLMAEVQLIAESRALLTSYDDFIFALKTNQGLYDEQGRLFRERCAKLQASYEEKLGQLYLLAEKMGISPDAILELPRTLPAIPNALSLDSIGDLKSNPLLPAPRDNNNH